MIAMGKGWTFWVLVVVFVIREYKVLTDALKQRWVMNQTTKKPSSNFAEHLGAHENVFIAT